MTRRTNRLCGSCPARSSRARVALDVEQPAHAAPAGRRDPGRSAGTVRSRPELPTRGTPQLPPAAAVAGPAQAGVAPTAGAARNMQGSVAAALTASAVDSRSSSWQDWVEMKPNRLVREATYFTRRHRAASRSLASASGDRQRGEGQSSPGQAQSAVVAEDLDSEDLVAGATRQASAAADIVLNPFSVSTQPWLRWPVRCSAQSIEDPLTPAVAIVSFVLRVRLTAGSAHHCSLGCLVRRSCGELTHSDPSAQAVDRNRGSP